jgi:two-component system, NtrC family, response regulator AlgB
MEAAAVLSQGETVTLAALPEAVTDSGPNAIMPASSKASLQDVERRQIIRILAESATLEQAAATLGLNITTLWRKRKRYQLDLATGWRQNRMGP